MLHTWPPVLDLPLVRNGPLGAPAFLKLAYSFHKEFLTYRPLIAINMMYNVLPHCCFTHCSHQFSVNPAKLTILWRLSQANDEIWVAFPVSSDRFHCISPIVGLNISLKTFLSVYTILGHRKATSFVLSWPCVINWQGAIKPWVSKQNWNFININSHKIK